MNIGILSDIHGNHVALFLLNNGINDGDGYERKLRTGDSYGSS